MVDRPNCKYLSLPKHAGSLEVPKYTFLRPFPVSRFQDLSSRWRHAAFRERRFLGSIPLVGGQGGWNPQFSPWSFLTIRLTQRWFLWQTVGRDTGKALGGGSQDPRLTSPIPNQPFAFTQNSALIQKRSLSQTHLSSNFPYKVTKVIHWKELTQTQGADFKWFARVLLLLGFETMWSRRSNPLRLSVVGVATPSEGFIKYRSAGVGVFESPQRLDLFTTSPWLVLRAKAVSVECKSSSRAFAV